MGFNVIFSFYVNAYLNKKGIEIGVSMIDFHHSYTSYTYESAIWISMWHNTRHENLICISWQMHEAIYIALALFDIPK